MKKTGFKYLFSLIKKSWANESGVAFFLPLVFIAIGALAIMACPTEPSDEDGKKVVMPECPAGNNNSNCSTPPPEPPAPPVPPAPPEPPPEPPAPPVPPAPPLSPPSTPANVTLTSALSESMIVSWTEVSGAENYVIHYQLSDGTPGLPFMTVTSTENSATITGLERGKYYNVYIIARNAGGDSTPSVTQRTLGRIGDPAIVASNFIESRVGNMNGIPVSVVDVQGFGEDEHGKRIADTFLANTDRASLMQIETENSQYKLNNTIIENDNSAGYIRHVLGALERESRTEIFWSASDYSVTYKEATRSDWFSENGRVFTREAREFATWMQFQNTLFITSIENPYGIANSDGTFSSGYCDDPYVQGTQYSSLCGDAKDYIAHSGVGIEKTIFVGAIDVQGSEPNTNEVAQGAIRADGVFAPHTIYVISPDGSTSHAAAVLAAYATEIAFLKPNLSASELKTELMRIAQLEEDFTYFTGGTVAIDGDPQMQTVETELRDIMVIREEHLENLEN